MPRTSPSRIQVHDVRPAVDGGRWPVKRTLGDSVVVEADLVRDGHEQLRAVVRHRPPGSPRFLEEPMVQVSPDRWRGSFTTTALGRHQFQVEAWVDTFGSWRAEVERKLEAGQEDLDGELAEGAEILDGIAAAGLRGADRRTALAAAGALRERGGPERAEAALAPETAVALERATVRPERMRATPLEVDFTWFGVYDVRVTKSGYEPLITSREAKAPLHETPPPGH